MNLSLTISGQKLIKQKCKSLSIEFPKHVTINTKSDRVTASQHLKNLSEQKTTVNWERNDFETFSSEHCLLMMRLLTESLTYLGA